MNKEGISSLVAAVLLILITVAAVGIIWGAVLPVITKTMELNRACLNARILIDTDQGYTCYNPFSREINVMLSRDSEEFELWGAEIIVNSKGESNSFRIEQNKTYFNIKMYAGTYNETIELPKKNEAKSYTFNISIEPETLKAVPIVKIGTTQKKCAYSSIAVIGKCTNIKNLCIDRTNFGQCSLTKPKYCDNGTLVNNCSSCSCLSGQSCNSTTQLCYIPANYTCSDNTQNASCSLLQPRYCNNGILIDKCSNCGCSSGKICNITNEQCYAPIFDGIYHYSMKGSTVITQQQADFLVSHYDDVMVKDYADPNTSTKILDARTRLNPDFNILRYANGMFSLSCTPTNEAAYSHNSSGQRILETDYALGWYLMDLCNNAWITEFTNCATSEILGYDGLFIDDMGMASGLSSAIRIQSMPGNVSPTTGWHQYTNAEWYKCGNDFLSSVKTSFSTKKIIFNGLYHNSPYLDREYLGVTDGGMREGFILKDTTNIIFGSVSEWKTLLNLTLSDTKTYNKNIYASCVMLNSSATVENRMFCFTSYLLINNNTVLYSPPKYSNITYWPEMDIALGKPTETANIIDDYLDQGAYARNFSNGLVLVNPSISPVTYLLGKNYSLATFQGGGIVDDNGQHSGAINYQNVSQVVISGQTGVILLNE